MKNIRRNNNGGGGSGGGHTNIVPQKVFISRLFRIRVRAFSLDMHFLAFVSLHLTQTYILCAAHLYTHQRLWGRRSSKGKVKALIYIINVIFRA